MSRPPLNAWQVEFLRATAFTNDVISPSYTDELWAKVVGTDAESVSRKPALATFSASGPIDGAMLNLSVSPGRIDWLLAPATVEAVLEQSLGAFENQDNQFADRLSSWLQFPSVTVTRIALGELLRLPTPSRIAAYRTLGTFLPRIAPDPESSQDFLYQINRPRQSRALPGLLINRLTKWAAIQLNIALVGNNKLGSSQQFVRLELDLSTDKDSQRDLSKDNGLSPLFRELQSMGREIATGGDIP